MKFYLFETALALEDLKKTEALYVFLPLNQLNLGLIGLLLAISPHLVAK